VEKKSQSYAIDTDSAIDQVAIDYKLKLIAFQDEIFRARKKLQDSDRRVASIVESMDTYLQNKENQLAEVMFTARMNAQRIESQARTQVEKFLAEIEDEIEHKEKDLQHFEKKAGEKGIALNELVSPKVTKDSEHLKVVKDVSPEPEQKVTLTKTEEKAIASVPPPTSVESVTLPEKLASHLETIHEAKTIIPAEIPVEPAATESRIRDNVVEIETKATEKVAQDDQNLSKKRVVAKKSTKSRAERNKSLLAEEIEKTEEAAPITQAEAIMDTDVITAQEVMASTEVDMTAAEPLEIAEITVADEAEVPAAILAENLEQELAPAEEPALEPVHFQPPPPAAPHETMRMDAFLDVRYYDRTTQDKQIQHHALQVTVDVEVPEDNYAVRYTKVNSDIVSALLRYDNVVLNDVYPFDFIDPNPQSIATYFFNYLEDTLSLMDLKLKSVTILEIPDLTIQVSARSTVLDNMLHKDTDEFESLRASIKPCVEPERQDGADIKKRLNKLFGKK